MSEKFNKIISRLLEKTKNSEIHWKRTSERVFISSVQNFSFVLDSDMFGGKNILSVINEEGVEIESATTEDPEIDSRSLYELYESAKRDAYNVEGALDAIINQLEEV